MQPYEKYENIRYFIQRVRDQMTDEQEMKGWDHFITEINLAIAPVENSVIAMHLKQIVENLQEIRVDMKRQLLVKDKELIQDPDSDYGVIKAAVEYLQKAIEKLKQLPN